MNILNHCIHRSEPHGQSGTVFIINNHAKIFCLEGYGRFRSTRKTPVTSDSNMAKNVYVIPCNVLATLYQCCEERQGDVRLF